METRITVNGEQVDAAPAVDLAEVIAETVREKPPAERYLVVRDGKPEAEVMWDGEAQFDPGDGAELVRAEDWRGERYTGPPEPVEERRRRTARERVDQLTDRVNDDIRAWPEMTAAQRTAATLRGLRLLRAVARELHNDIRDDEE